MRQKGKLKHRGVAPAIATIIVFMTTITGSAGTMAASQEFLNDEQVAFKPQIELIKIVGYDLRDQNRLQTSEGFYTSSDSAGIANGKISKNEKIAVYIQNDSPKEVWISKLLLAGKEYKFAGKITLDGFVPGSEPQAGQYVMLSKSYEPNLSSPKLEAGERATFFISLENILKVGRSVQINILTTNDYLLVGTLKIGGYVGPGIEPQSISFVQQIEEEEAEPVCSSAQIIFDTDASGNDLAAGAEINSQWHGIGIHISALNDHGNHPDMAIIFDSNNPTGQDGDLGGPWPFGNIPAETDLGKILIIAEDDVDSNNDGLVDDPDDEAKGGIIFIQSNNSHCTLSFTILDIEQNEGNSGKVVVKLEDGGEKVFGFNSFSGVQYANNSANQIYLGFEEIGGTFNSVEFHLNGSGGIDNVIFG